MDRRGWRLFGKVPPWAGAAPGPQRQAHCPVFADLLHKQQSVLLYEFFIQPVEVGFIFLFVLLLTALSPFARRIGPRFPGWGVGVDSGEMSEWGHVRSLAMR